MPIELDFGLYSRKVFLEEKLSCSNLNPHTHPPPHLMIVCIRSNVRMMKTCERLFSAALRLQEFLILGTFGAFVAFCQFWAYPLSFLCFCLQKTGMRPHAQQCLLDVVTQLAALM
jgi:hypothetical protein